MRFLHPLGTRLRYKPEQGVSKAGRGSLKALQDLREELDQRANFKRRDLDEYVTGIADQPGSDVDIDECVGFKDAEAADETENEAEVAADSLHFPIRHASEIKIQPSHDVPISSPPTPNVNPPLVSAPSDQSPAPTRGGWS